MRPCRADTTLTQSRPIRNVPRDTALALPNEAPVEKLRAPGEPIGLLNQGATWYAVRTRIKTRLLLTDAPSYLNSLLQVMYLTPEFRSTIYKLQWEAEAASTAADEPPASDDGAAPSAQLDYDIGPLLAMGFDEAMVMRVASVYPRNIDQCLECLLAGGLPASAVAPAAAEASGPTRSTGARLLHALCALFAELECSNRSCVSTADLTAAFGWTRGQSSQQHDVHELNRMLLEMIGKATKSELLTDLYK